MYPQNIILTYAIIFIFFSLIVIVTLLMIFATRPIRTLSNTKGIYPPTTKALYAHSPFPFIISSSALHSLSLPDPSTPSCREVARWKKIGHRGSVFNSPCSASLYELLRYGWPQPKLIFVYLWFLPRDAMQGAVLARQVVSVCLFVCL